MTGMWGEEWKNRCSRVDFAHGTWLMICCGVNPIKAFKSFAKDSTYFSSLIF